VVSARQAANCRAGNKIAVTSVPGVPEAFINYTAATCILLAISTPWPCCVVNEKATTLFLRSDLAAEPQVRCFKKSGFGGTNFLTQNLPQPGFNRASLPPTSFFEKPHLHPCPFQRTPIAINPIGHLHSCYHLERSTRNCYKLFWLITPKARQATIQKVLTVRPTGGPPCPAQKTASSRVILSLSKTARGRQIL